MNLNQDFQEFVELFVAHEVEFLIVGGYALAAHGHLRYTKDLDVWVWLGPENAQEFLPRLKSLVSEIWDSPQEIFKNQMSWCSSVENLNLSIF